MALSATDYSSDLSDIYGYAIYAEARLGGNGDVNGIPEFVTGGNGEDASYGRITWDSDLEDGFDSGNVSNGFSAEFNGDTNETDLAQVSGGTPISFSQSSAGPIDHVELRAMTQAAAFAQWSGVCIQFYKGDVLMDTYSSNNGPSVDTRGETWNYTAESTLVVTPNGTDYDKVVVSGSVRIAFDSPNVYPGATDVALQAFVFTSNS